MSSRDNLLNDVKSCSFEANDVDNVCCTDADSACGDGSAFTAIEQHPEENDHA